jgi:GGDEF domain-containing protein
MKSASQIARVILFFVFTFVTLRVHAEDAVRCADDKSQTAALTNISFEVACNVLKNLSEAEIAEKLKEELKTNCIDKMASGEIDGAQAAWADAVAIWHGAISAVKAIPEIDQRMTDLIQSYWNKRDDPVSGAAEVAEQSVSNQTPFVDRVRANADFLNQKFSSVVHAFATGWKQFSCLPREMKNQLIQQTLCHDLTKEILQNALIGTAAKDAVSGLKMAIAAKKLVAEARVTAGAANLSTAESFDLATEALRASQKGEVVNKIGNASLVQYVDPATNEKYVKLEEQVTGVDGKIHNFSRELPVDVNTGAIDARQAIGRTVMDKMATQSGEPVSLIFGDINNLNVTNYFKGGMATGDAYLKAVTDIMQKQAGDKPILFKMAGDEFVVFVKSTDPKVVRKVVDSIASSVAKDPTITPLFKGRLIEKVDDYRAVRKAASIDQLPASVTESLTAQEKAAAHTDFAAFKKNYLETQIGEVRDQARYRGSVSLGSTIIGKNDSLSHALERAEAQEAANKFAYKREAGFTSDKYGGRSTAASKPNFNAKPPTSDPIPAPEFDTLPRVDSPSIVPDSPTD